MESLDEIILSLPLDCHLHLRDGAALKDTVAHASRIFDTVVVMPNLDPPIVSVTDALNYKRRIEAHAQHSMQALFALYLTDATTYDHE